MTDDMTRRSGDEEQLEEAVEGGPVTEGLDLRDPAAGDPDRIRKMPPEDLDVEGRSAARGDTAGGEATGLAGGASVLAGGAGVGTEASNPETRRVAEGREVDDDDAVAMPTDPGGGTH